MLKAVFVDWRIGLQKVPLANLLRKSVGLSLRESEEAVDEILAGRTVQIDLSTCHDIDRFMEDARGLGANSIFRELWARGGCQVVVLRNNLIRSLVVRRTMSGCIAYCARVFLRVTDDSVEILGKSTKANQQQAIDLVLETFGD